MAYKCYQFYNSSQSQLLNAIFAFLVNQGWELHDEISSVKKVFKSNGESGNEPYGYVWIDGTNSTYIYFHIYQYWNETTHAGVRGAYNANPSSNNCYFSGYGGHALLGGDKNLIFILNKITDTQNNSNGVMFGHMPQRFNSTLTKTTDAIVAGSSVSIPVVSSSGFAVGMNVQIVGTTEGCDKLTISAIADSTHITVGTLPRNYASGATIGIPASTFGVVRNADNSKHWLCSYYNDAGTTVSGSGTYNSLNTWTNSFYNQSGLTRKVAPTPFYSMNTANATYAAVGYIPSRVLYYINAANWGVFFRVNDNSIPRVRHAHFGTDTTITDLTANWTVNEHAGRFVCIVMGYGSGHIRKIISNTSDTLTVASWGFTPDGTSEFKIVDQVWRSVSNSFSGSCIFEITEDGIPS